MEVSENAIAEYEQSIKNLKEEVSLLKKALRDKAAHLSWVNNPDRSGGQFTAEEIERSKNTW